MTTKEKIKKLEKKIEELEEVYYHKDRSANTGALEREIELLENGISDYIKNRKGFYIEDKKGKKILIAAKKQRWMNHYHNWYWFKDIPHLKQILGI